MSRLLESIRTKAKLLQKAKLKSNPDFKLKTAYEILAKSAGFSSWREWKEVLDEHSLYSPPSSAHWHCWYSSYEEALKHLKQKPGCYLIPYQKHFFIGDGDSIRAFGVDVDDPDLLQVGFDWAQPKDSRAWSNLLKKLEKNKAK